MRLCPAADVLRVAGAAVVIVVQYLEVPAVRTVGSHHVEIQISTSDIVIVQPILLTAVENSVVPAVFRAIDPGQRNAGPAPCNPDADLDACIERGQVGSSPSSA